MILRIKRDLANCSRADGDLKRTSGELLVSGAHPCRRASGEGVDQVQPFPIQTLRSVSTLAVPVSLDSLFWWMSYY